MLRQVGEFESSKSAMKPRAPEFRALMTILRLVGPGDLDAPVLERIRHRSDRKSSGAVTKSSFSPASSRGLELLAGVEQLAAAAVELLVEPADQRERSVSERFVVASAGLGCSSVRSSSASCR